jgi:hypothetical protein
MYEFGELSSRFTISQLAHDAFFSQCLSFLKDGPPLLVNIV